MNIGKTQFMVLCRNRKRNVCVNLIISHRGVDIACKGSIRYLGVTVDSQLKWKEHIQHVRQKCFMSLPKLRRVSHFLPLPLDWRYTMHLYYLMLCVLAFMWIGPHSKSGADTELRDEDLQYARTWGQNDIHLGRPCTNFYQLNFKLLYRGIDFHQN